MRSFPRLSFTVRRTGGFVIDRIWAFGLWLVLSSATAALLGFAPPVTRLWLPLSVHYAGLPWLLIVDLVLGFVFALPIVEWLIVLAILVTSSCALHGATPGMRSMGLALRRTDGESVGVVRVLVRHLLSYASVLPLGMGYWWSLIDPRCRTWHDIMTGVVVIDACGISIACSEPSSQQ